MRHRTVLTAAFVVAAALRGPAAVAQEAPVETTRVMIGPLSVTPRFEIREAGVDDNVFNDSENPQSDFTATFTPRLSGELVLGSMRTSFGSFVDVVHFSRFTGERSVNRGAEARWEMAEGLLRPYMTGSFLETHDRANAEIDLRAGRRHRAYGGGVGLAITPGSVFTVSARRALADFDEGAVFRGIDISRTMTSRVETYDGTLRLSLTPFTTWALSGALQHDRFPEDPDRDSDSITFSTGLEFSPSALISGRAAVGYRRFEPLADRLDAFSGVTAQIALKYALEGTRLDGLFEHDVRYSFEELQPYYVTTNGRLVATRRIAGPVDIQAVIGRTRMNYREYDQDDAEARHDRVLTYGAGTGYRFGEWARLGFNVEWSRRRSDQLSDRHYDKRRVYGSLTYGF